MGITLTHALFLFVPVLAGAQSLTNAQVYDLALGDVLYTRDQWYGNGGYAAPLFVRDSVIDKQFNVGGYEVLYTFSSQRFRAPIGPFDAEDTTLVYDWGYLDGAAVPDHYIEPGGGINSDGPYAPSMDTILADPLLCGYDAWKRTYEPCDTCFVFGPPAPWYSSFAEGLGGPYYMSPQSFFTDIFYDHQLIFFRKNGVECGTDPPMSVRPERVQKALVLFPDPVEDVLHWNDARPGRAEVIALNGVVIRRAPATGELDVRMLEPGAYVLQLAGADGAVRRARFVKR